MRLEKKDLLLLIPTTLLAIAGLGPDDPWVVGPCLFFSWVTFIVICAIHEGQRRTRIIVGILITLALSGVGYRRFNSIYHALKKESQDTANKEHLPPPDTSSQKEARSEESKKVQPNKESKPSPPFAVQIESLMASQHPQKNETPFLAVYRSGDTAIASPGRIALYMRFTNLQKQPAMVSKYSVKWGKYKLTKITGPPTEMFYLSDGNMHRACWVNDTDILDKQLVGLNLQPRVPVEGVALFDYPAESRPESLSESYLKVGLTVTITDVEGVSFTTAPIKPQPDPANESVQSRIVRFNRGTRDLSNFKIADFGVPHGFISPPF